LKLATRIGARSVGCTDLRGHDQLAFLWSVGGVSWLRHFAFPVAFTLIAVPWVSPLEEPIVQGLMRVVAAISSELVALFGIPAQLEGNLIRIPNGLVGVNEACSGVRSLQTRS